MEAPARFAPFLRSRTVRLVLVLAPALITMVAMFGNASSSLGVAVVLNAATGTIIASALFVVVSMTATRMADERVVFAQSASGGFWRVRPQLPSIRRPGSYLYADWYFRLRLHEEIERCERYGLHVTVLVGKAEDGAKGSRRLPASTWFDERFGKLLRRSDLPALLRDGSLGVILTQTARDAALHARLTRALSLDSVAIGLACYPEDGLDVGSLLRTADLAADGKPAALITPALPTVEQAA